MSGSDSHFSRRERREKWGTPEQKGSDIFASHARSGHLNNGGIRIAVC